jgi:parallel beta-helix repeat protein
MHRIASAALPIALTFLGLSAPAIAQNVATVYIDAQRGIDRADGGTPTKPLRTITYALQRRSLRNGTILQLAAGSYRAEQGERFPLRIPRGITLRGDEATKGQNVIIAGGGPFAGQSVALTLGDRAQLRGVTVTNPLPRGYGIWLENTSPVLVSNRIRGNSQDGIVIRGASQAMILQNLIERNGTSGVAIEAASSPEVRGNLIRDNGYGISIRQQAAPQIAENEVRRNQDGVLVQGSARPLLRQNQILDNQRYGLSVLSNALPDLGTASDPGNNRLQGNQEGDLLNQTPQTLSLVGNQVARDRIQGQVTLQAAVFSRQLLTGTAPAPLPQTPAPLVIPQQVPSQQVVVRLTPEVPEVGVVVLSPALPPIRRTPPAGEAVNKPIIIAPPTTQSRDPSQPVTPPRYRVVVPGATPAVTLQVRRLIPNAFNSRARGREVLQIGAYSDRRMAELQVRRLVEEGIRAQIERIDSR